VSGRRQSQRVTRARYAAIGDWRVQGVMGSAGGVFCGCYLMGMLPLRRRSRPVCIGTRALAVSRRDRPAMDFAVGMIQPNCRHYAAGLTQECHLLACYGECNHNQSHRIVETSRVQREWHVQRSRQGPMCFCQIDRTCASFNITPSFLGAWLEAYIRDATSDGPRHALLDLPEQNHRLSTILDTRRAERRYLPRASVTVLDPSWPWEDACHGGKD
jgi:hypothetical protein